MSQVIIDKINKALDEFNSFHHNQVDSEEFKKWYRNTVVLFQRDLGEDYARQFTKLSYRPTRPSLRTDSFYCKKAFANAKINVNALLKSFVDEINDYGIKQPESSQPESGLSSFKHIENICNKFHSVVRQLRARYDERDTIDVNDEYDVQDLFHALLKLHFEDVRPEDYSPSYAGGNSRVDFVLPVEKIVVEIKKTRSSLKDKKLGEELIIDSARYSKHPDCEILICFVYDPDGYISNPRGLENDLSKGSDDLTVKVFIRPQ